jgi:hypothetical protein
LLAWFLALGTLTPACYRKPQAPAPDQAGARVEGKFEGTLDRADTTRVAGWVWDKNRPETPISVEIYEDDTLLATVTADQFREGLKKAGKGDGRHGFVYRPSGNLKDGKTHSVRAVIAGTQSDLVNSPRQVESPDKAKSQPKDKVQPKDREKK